MEKKQKYDNKSSRSKAIKKENNRKKCTQEHLRNALKSLCLRRNKDQNKTRPQLFKYTHALQEE